MRFNPADKLLRISKKQITTLFTFMLLGLAGSTSYLFAVEIPARPQIFGVAHYSTFVCNLAKARDFYDNFPGYEEALALPNG